MAEQDDLKVLLIEGTPPSTLVTDAGKRAWLARETRLANFSVEMFLYIRDNTPVASDLFTAFPDVDRADISDTMWRLLDALFIEITPDRKLSAIK